MKPTHQTTLKFHTIYSAILAAIFVVLMLVFRDFALGIALLFLLLYVSGNGIMHVKNNKLTRDTIIEYVLVSLVVLVILIDVLL